MEIQQDDNNVQFIEFHDGQAHVKMHTDSFNAFIETSNMRVIDRATGMAITLLNGQSCRGRISLSRERVTELLPHLQAFVNSGTINPGADATQHPLWPEWYDWYTEHYTNHIPLYKGVPANTDTLLSWETFLAARGAK
jgi:hypothetical protein